MDARKQSYVDGAEIGPELEALRAQLAVHPGKIARLRWDEVGRSHAVWSRNTQELMALLQAGENQEDLIAELVQNVRAPLIRNEFLAQLDQRLHNMTASAVSLVDHTRKLLKHYPKTAFASAFESRNTVIRDAPSSQFIRRFRNYLLHYGHAPFELTASWSGSSALNGQITLSRASLLEWADWGASARTFIQDGSDGIRLSSTVQEYAGGLAALYAWTFEQFETLHGADTDGANDLVRRINLTMTGGAHDGRNMESFYKKVEEKLRTYRREQD
jgi:hypothetical protein